MYVIDSNLKRRLFIFQTAEDVSEFNINSLFHELATNEKYELPTVVEDKSPDKSNSEAKLQG